MSADERNQSLPPSGLFEAAAQLVERALGQLNLRNDTCPSCGCQRFERFAHARVHRRFIELPPKLRAAAEVLKREGV